MMPTRPIRSLPLVAMTMLVAACSSGDTPSDAAQPSEGPATATPAATSSDTPRSDAPSEPAPSDGPPADALLAMAFTDVRTGETFTLGELAADEGPVLLEPMAVWCTSCLSQQRAVRSAHEGGAFTSVSLDVDLSESAEDLAAYADREGFDWRFAMADAELYRDLQERFGTGVTNPPLTPLIVIEADGTVRALEFGRGVRNPEQLLTEIGAG